MVPIQPWAPRFIKIHRMYGACRRAGDMRAACSPCALYRKQAFTAGLSEILHEHGDRDRFETTGGNSAKCHPTFAFAFTLVLGLACTVVSFRHRLNERSRMLWAFSVPSPVNRKTVQDKDSWGFKKRHGSSELKCKPPASCSIHERKPHELSPLTNQPATLRPFLR